MPFVTTQLYGRLGNQAFQIAATIALALRNNAQYLIPGGTNGNRDPYYFSHFPRKTPQQRVLSFYEENGHNYTPIKYSPDMCLNGYWQSHKYWEDYADVILPMFRINPVAKPGVVSIHKRLGDYKMYPTKHPVVSDDYMRKAVATFTDKGYKNFLVFSDDIKDCKAFFSDANFPGCNFSYSEGKGPIEDLTEMAGCEHQLISNSTFSLWAYHFNKNAEKICVAPSRWFGPDLAHLNTSDIYPKNCIII